MNLYLTQTRARRQPLGIVVQALDMLKGSGWTLAMVAKAIGTSISTLVNWRYGRTEPTRKHLDALLKLALPALEHKLPEDTPELTPEKAPPIVSPEIRGAAREALLLAMLHLDYEDNDRLMGEFLGGYGPERIEAWRTGKLPMQPAAQVLCLLVKRHPEAGKWIAEVACERLEDAR